MVGWQRHLQSLVTRVAKRYDCSHNASFSTFSQAKASLVSGEISSLPSLRNSLNPTMSRSPFLHMQKMEFTSSRILLAAEGVKQKSRSSKVASPKNIKFPKHFKGRINGVASKGIRISFGQYALQALEPAWITERQIEAGRRAIVRDARGGKIWVRLIPDKPVTRKPAETRMGRGKGNPAFRVAGVRAGRILYEVGGVSEAIAKRAFTLAASKMPINTRFISLR